MGMPAARTLDNVAHPLPGMLMPGPGSFNVVIGGQPAWRGLPAAMALALQAAKQVTDAVLTVAETAKTAAMGTPGAPAAIAAETLARQAASTALGALMSGMGAACSLLGGTPDTHLCLTPLPPPVPHGPGMVIDGSTCVLTNGLPQCAMGDNVLEALGPLDPIIKGMATVQIGKGGTGGGLFAMIAALIKNLIDKALAVIDAAAEFAKSLAAFVTNLVNAVIDGIMAAIARIGREIAEAIAKALTALKKAFEPKPPKPVKTGLGDDVDKIANKSPTLRSNIEKLQADGWTIKYGEAGKGSTCDKKTKTILIDPNKKGDPAGITRSLAHESGHGLYKEDPYVPHNGLTKDEYVSRNVARNLKDEGEATLTNAQVRKEINDAGGPDIGISGTQQDKYQAIADKYPDPADRDKARKEIGDLFGNGEKASVPPHDTYNDYYGKTYKDFYDAHPQP